MDYEELLKKAIDLPEALTNKLLSRHPYMRKYSDDLYSAACDALLHGARTYDKNRCKSFRAYATVLIITRLNWKLKDLARKAIREPTGLVQDVAATAIVPHRLPPEYYSRVTPRQAEVVALRFECGCSFSQIAVRLKCSKANAYRLYRKALKNVSVN